jgi:protein-disulfide isomerase
MKQFSLKLILYIILLTLSLTLIKSANSDQINEIKDDDRFLGNIDAPITVIEYASLSCQTQSV